MTDRVRKNLSRYRSEHPDVLANLARLQDRGRSVRHRTHVEDLHRELFAERIIRVASRTT
jgi:hypothetical protein